MLTVGLSREGVDGGLGLSGIALGVSQLISEGVAVVTLGEKHTSRYTIFNLRALATVADSLMPLSFL